MKSIRQYLVFLAIGTTAVGFGSYGLLASTEEPVTKEITSTIIDKGGSSSGKVDTLSVSIYQADSQCENLVPETVTVPTANAISSAVGIALEERNSNDFEIAGYRVSVNTQTGTANIDLRLSPDSRRQFVSLSNCEQFALFGSLRRTLLGNSQLNIKDVRFTEQGKELYL